MWTQHMLIQWEVAWLLGSSSWSMDHWLPGIAGSRQWLPRVQQRQNTWLCWKQPSRLYGSGTSYIQLVRKQSIIWPWWPSMKTTRVWLNSQITLSSVNHLKTKHIAVHYHAIWEHIANSKIQLEYLPTDWMIANSLTKATNHVTQEQLVDGLGLA